MRQVSSSPYFRSSYRVRTSVLHIGSVPLCIRQPVCPAIVCKPTSNSTRLRSQAVQRLCPNSRMEASRAAPRPLGRAPPRCRPRTEGIPPRRRTSPLLLCLPRAAVLGRLRKRRRDGSRCALRCGVVVVWGGGGGGIRRGCEWGCTSLCLTTHLAVGMNRSTHPERSESDIVLAKVSEGRGSDIPGFLLCYSHPPCRPSLPFRSSRSARSKPGDWSHLDAPPRADS